VILASTKEKGSGEIFNITCGKGRNLADFVKCVQKEYKDLTFKFTKRDKFRPKRGTLSIDKAKKLLNFRPKFTLEKGVAKYLGYIKEINNK
jgi:nucleoside-diphosphate-sugar epimerase